MIADYARAQPAEADAAVSIHRLCQGEDVAQRPGPGVTLVSQKMGLQQWSYSNDYDPVRRTKMRHVDLSTRFEGLAAQVVPLPP
mgnify:CR=1 FL=1